MIHTLTNQYLQHIGGTLNADTMSLLNTQQHTLLAYRILLDEVMEGGFIQLIQNGYGPYVLEGPFPMIIKKEWGLVQFGKFLYGVKKEYHRHREELEAEYTEDEFMALYEQFETMNELGDQFLDDFQETITPQINSYVENHLEQFQLTPQSI